MLALTTPFKRGPAVERAQRLLKNNPFGEFYKERVDGEYGPVSHEATRLAKKMLGYPSNLINGKFGDNLEEFLAGKKTLPISYRLRRRARRQARELRTLPQDALKIARGEIGTHEQGFDNDNKYGRWYGANHVPWCAIFVTYCYSKAGASKATFDPDDDRYAFVPFLVNDCDAGRHNLERTKDPRPGDIVTYQFDSDPNSDHVGIFEKWVSRERGSFLAIEGNTSLSSDANGGQVMRRTRLKSQVTRFIRVDES